MIHIRPAWLRVIVEFCMQYQKAMPGHQRGKRESHPRGDSTGLGGCPEFIFLSKPLVAFSLPGCSQARNTP